MELGASKNGRHLFVKFPAKLPLAFFLVNTFLRLKRTRSSLHGNNFHSQKRCHRNLEGLIYGDFTNYKRLDFRASGQLVIG